MKTPSPSPQSGVALVIVLSFLVLISAIIIGFFASVSTELIASKAVATSSSVHQLADSAVNVVMAQIVDATKGQDSSGSTLAWASQPGVIRTFDGTSQPGDIFKLYSSNQLVVSGTNFDTATEVPPATWSKADNAALYTDLNEPALVADPTGPIRPDPTKTDKFTAVYPIMNPYAEGVVDGFKLTSRPGYPLAGLPSVAYDPTRVTVKDSTPNPAPMPVQWLYVLKDGSMKAASSPNAGRVTVTGATATNPIVGRIAFWTDDETCKVNINTASEGVYWDVPRIMSQEDYGNNNPPLLLQGLARGQPVQREYQRYPGHPASTSLSAVFGNANWSPPLLPVPSIFPVNPTITDAQMLDPYYNIAPRIGLPSGGGGGGSQSGSIQVDENASVMTTDGDRLYASVDELMFTPNVSGSARIPNTSTASAPQTITRDVLEKTRFFLTASSSAPETTVFNTPRVAVWPVNNTPSKNTAYDQLLTFCSTIGGKAYCFTRSNARSSTADYNLTASDGTRRNQILYAYLQSLTGREIPGFGGIFLSKYPAGATGGATERDQILTYIYDYIRCTNLQDQSFGATPFTPLFAYSSTGETPGAGEVIPIKIGRTQGFGRFYSVSSASLLFYATGKDPANKVNKMRAMFLLVPSSPQQGLACSRGNLKYKVTKGLDGLQANGISLNFKAGGTNYIDASDMNSYGGRGVGGTESPYATMIFSDSKGTAVKLFNDTDAGGDAHYKYPFFSASDVDVDVTKTSFSFTANSEIEVEIRAAEAADSEPPVQTLRFNFPAGQFKTPSFRADPTDNTTFYPPSKRNPGNGSVVMNSDTVVALEVGGSDLNANASSPGRAVDNSAGDSRMIAGLADVPANRFRPHFNYMDSSIQLAHSMTDTGGAAMSGAKTGNLARDVATYPSRKPALPSRVSPLAPLTGATRAPASGGGPGDWDSGWGDQKDGAYINKPDEGDSQFGNQKNRIPYSTGYNFGFASATNTYFSPNRMIPSPLMLGSLPTGVQRSLPWQTLLFHPRPEDTTHPGFGTPRSPASGVPYKLPPDHLIADLFWMPVVEPYAISQPFATSGKINLNYQVAPFTYIYRATGIHAVMKSTKFAAVPAEDVKGYKETLGFYGGALAYIPNRRRNIDMDKTLVAFDEKFKNNDLFRSASQICEVNLVPSEVTTGAATVAATNTAMATFWNNNPLTGDNLREKPYVDLYSRLTTKSNTYTVHVRVQALKKVPGTPLDQWVTGRDQVLGEYRGSSLLERYIDLNDPKLPDFATLFVNSPQDAALNIDQYYRMRVVSKKRFAP